MTIGSVSDSLLDKLLHPIDLRTAFSFNALFEGGEEGENEGEGEEENDEQEDGETEEDGSADSKVKDQEKKRLSDEAAKHRNEAKKARKELEAAQVKLKEHEDKDRTDLEKAERDRDEYKGKLEKAQELVMSQAKELAFFASGASDLFRSPSTGLKLLQSELSKLEMSDDGTLDPKEVMTCAEALLKSDPYLAKDKGEAEDSDGEPSGRQTNGRRKDRESLSEQKLAEKFPALRK